MITLYGTNNCGKCVAIKSMLEDKGVEFEYKTLDNLPQEEQDEIIDVAQSNRINSFPIIVKDREIIKDVEEI